MNPDSITINIPVHELERAVSFYSQLGLAHFFPIHV